MTKLDLGSFHERERAISSETSVEEFDRVAYAARALEVLRPRGLRVALCEGTRAVRVSVGRDWGGPPTARWAMVSIPRSASRRAIGQALLTLAEPSAPPYTVDCLARLPGAQEGRSS